MLTSGNWRSIQDSVSGQSLSGQSVRGEAQQGLPEPLVRGMAEFCSSLHTNSFRQSNDVAACRVRTSGAKNKRQR